jgi:hypothetical protein
VREVYIQKKNSTIQKNDLLRMLLQLRKKIDRERKIVQGSEDRAPSVAIATTTMGKKFVPGGSATGELTSCH